MIALRGIFGKEPTGLLAALVLVLVGEILPTRGVNAQETGQVRFRFEPPQGVSYVVDGKYRLSDREITLQEGRHNFVFWAPERRMLDTALFVVGGQTQDVRLSLRYSLEYVEHRRALERYEKQQRYSVLLPSIATFATGTWATVSTIRMIRRGNDLRDLKDTYATLSDPVSIARLKQQDLPEARSDLRSARSGFYISTGLFAISTATVLYMKQRSGTRIKPEFKDNEGLRFNGLVWAPGEHGGTWATGLTYIIR